MSFFFFNDTATTEIYTLSLHDALPISLVRGLVGEVAALFDAARVPGALLRVHGVEARVLLHLVADVVEDVELRLRSEERGVGDAGGGEVLLGLLGDLARVLRVDLAVTRVVDVEH